MFINVTHYYINLYMYISVYMHTQVWQKFIENKRCVYRSRHVGLAVKMLLGICASHVRGPGLNRGLSLSPSFLRGQQVLLRHLDSCCPHGRPGLSSGHCTHGENEAAHRASLSLSLCLSVFQTNVTNSEKLREHRFMFVHPSFEIYPNEGSSKCAIWKKSGMNFTNSFPSK